MVENNKSKYSVLFWFILSASIISIFLTLGVHVWYKIAYRNLLENKKKNFARIAQTISNEIIQFIVQQKKAVENLSENELIKTTFAKNIDKNKLEKLFEAYRETIFFKRILLVTAEGNFIFSTKPDKIVGKKITPQDYLESFFVESFDRVLKTATLDISPFKIDTIFNEPILFLNAPVIENIKILGVLAVQLDEQKIYQFLRTYKDLGRTGENLLGGVYSVYSNVVATDSLIISPTRHNPNIAFKYLGIGEQATPTLMLLALKGESHVGIELDYRHKMVVAASRFIPMVNWALITKQDLKEIEKKIEYISILYSIFLICALIFGFWLLIGYYSNLINYGRKLGFLSFLFTLPFDRIVRFLLFLGLIFFCLTFYFVHKNFNKQKSIIFETLKSVTEERMNLATINIEDYLKTIKEAADSIADDLSNNRLKDEDLIKRIKRNLSEYWYEIKNIAIVFEPYAYNKKIKFYAPSLTKEYDKFHEKNLALNYKDLTSELDWYVKTVKNGAQWFDPVNYEDGETSMYTVPFYSVDGKMRGIVAVTYNMQFIKDIVQSIVIGKTGYPFLIDRDGHFFYHPVSTYVKERKTILDIAQEQANEELSNLAKNIIAGKKGSESYQDFLAKQKVWIIYQPIKPTGWALSGLFPEQEVLLNSQITRRTMIWLLLIAILALWCGILLLIFIFVRQKTSLLIVICTSIILSIALLMFWFIIIKTSLIIDTDGVIITEPSMLDRIIQEAKQEARRKNEPIPKAISTGLFIYSLDFSNRNQVSLVARAWQQLQAKKMRLSDAGIQIPNAQHITIEQIFQEKEESKEVIGWKIQASLPQNYNYKLFPFDVLHTVILLEQKDITKNILLVPDLKSYPSMSPQSLPGIDESIGISGFTIQKSFFSFEPVGAITAFGMQSYKEISDRMMLQYNIIITRNLLNPLVIYFLPLLVVLISLFVIFWLTAQATPEEINRYIFGILSAYTGFFFALILLQRNLRSDFSGGDILYIEYFFFYTYITILFFIVYSVFLYAYSKYIHMKYQLSNTISLLFWPTQLILWLATSIAIFY